MKEYQVETSFSIKYTTKEPVPIKDVIRSLKSIEKMLMRTGPFIEKTHPGFKVIETKVFIDEIHAGSLSNSFIVRLILGGKENAEKADALIDDIIKDGAPMKTIIAVGATAVLIYGIMQATPKSESKAIESYNSVIFQAAGDINLSKADMQEVLGAIRDKQQLVKESIDVVYPSKNENAAIEISGIKQLTIPTEVIRSTPSEYEPPVPDEKTDRYKNRPVMIYASDRDNLDKGWAGIVPDIQDTRIKLVLAEDLDPKKLHGKISVYADVAVISKYQPSNKSYRVTAVMIENIIEK